MQNITEIVWTIQLSKPMKNLLKNLMVVVFMRIIKKTKCNIFLLFLFLSIFLVQPATLFAGSKSEDKEALFDLSLEELLEVRVSNVATLTPTTWRQGPAAVTMITQEMIQASGARSLDKVLEIFVPNFQMMRNHFDPPAIGMRGVIGDHNDKILLLVNHRVMNHRLRSGAFSERDLPMLGDIHHVDVVRGPGSVIYGPGAVAGVINIVTYSGLSFSGFDVTLRQGAVERFSSVEMRYGHSFKDGSGLFIDYGLSDYSGADQDDSPYVLGKSFKTMGDEFEVKSGHSVPFKINDDHRSSRSELKHKLHVQYDNGPFTAWTRYTSGGSKTLLPRGAMDNPPIGGMPYGWSVDEFSGRQFAYQQLTLFADYDYQVNSDLDIVLALSYDLFDFEDIGPSDDPLFFAQRSWHETRSSREDEYFAEIMGRWRPSDSHFLALSLAWSHEIFGLESIGFPHEPATTNVQGRVHRWSTDTWSVASEYQWSINPYWTLFAGCRFDDHTYSDWLVSPRVALVFMPTDRDTAKFIVSQSVRRSGDDELRGQYLADGSNAEDEQIQSCELRYERQQNDHLWFAGSLFYENIELVARNPSSQRNDQVGEYDAWGLELELCYQSEGLFLTLSHSYTKMLSFDLADVQIVQPWSAEPYGYGDDLSSWSNHISKLHISYTLNPQWKINSNCQIYWGFPGAEDQTEYNNENLVVPWLGLSDPGYSKAFRPNCYLDLGVEYQPWESLTLRFDAYNILGWIDKDINKRNYIERGSDYRSEAAALGLMLKYRFLE